MLCQILSTGIQMGRRTNFPSQEIWIFCGRSCRVCLLAIDHCYRPHRKYSRRYCFHRHVSFILSTVRVSGLEGWCLVGGCLVRWVSSQGVPGQRGVSHFSEGRSPIFQRGISHFSEGRSTIFQRGVSYLGVGGSPILEKMGDTLPIREYGQCTVGTHPTGMHSCVKIFSEKTIQQTVIIHICSIWSLINPQHLMRIWLFCFVWLV